MARTKRTDPHRPGAIVPAEYEYLLSYNLGTTDGGEPIPPYGVNCQVDQQRYCYGSVRPHLESGRCCVLGAQAVAAAVFGGPGKCGVCGANFVYGDVWRHEPTGAVVHLGHDCASKYELLADRSAWELANGRARAAAAREVQKRANAEEREAFLSDHPGLADDLALGDENSSDRGRAILGDIARRFAQRRSLSDKQVALVRKLAEEIRNPPAPRPVEIPTQAPRGRVDFEGEVVSVKLHEGAFGDAIKITVKVSTDAGVWLAWGTAPRALLESLEVRGLDAIRDALRGRRVAMRATLEPAPARDASEYETDGLRDRVERQNQVQNFAFMKRPSGRLLANTTDCA